MDITNGIPAPSDPSSTPSPAPTSVADNAAAAVQTLSPTVQNVLAGGPTPPAPTPDAAPSSPQPAKGGAWRALVTGALSGLAGSAGARSFGAGLAGGAAAELEQARQQKLDALASQNQQSVIRFRDAQSAQLVNQAAVDAFKLNALPQQIQDTHNANAISTMKELQSMGYNPVAAVGDHDQAGAALSALTQSHGSVPPLFALHVGNQTVAFDLSHIADDDSGRILDTVNKYGRVLGRPALSPAQWSQLPTADKTKLINDSLGVTSIVPDPSKIDSQIAEQKFRIQTYGMQPSHLQDPDISAALQRNLGMLQSAQKDFDNHKVQFAAREQAAKSAAEAAAKRESDLASNWVPKVSADEKKKAELAENIASNANDVASILLKRPDIVGAVAGRFTSIEQMVGNNDPDISALATHIHNIAMANSGVHGFRSQEGVQSFENVMLNNFKNGPKAVAGALAASASSVQTFVDNARPDTYKTHSKRGGALRGMAVR